MGRYSLRRYKTKRRKKDLDLIFQDLVSQQNIQQLLNQPLDETKPGLGQFYCIHCANYYETATALKTHLKGKVHKRRVKELKSVPYTQEVANAAAGTDVNKFLIKVEQIKNQKGLLKEQNEVLLKEHFEKGLANSSDKDATLQYGIEQPQPPEQDQDGDAIM